MSETYANPSVHSFTNSQGAGERERSCENSERKGMNGGLLCTDPLRQKHEKQPLMKKMRARDECLGNNRKKKKKTRDAMQSMRRLQGNRKRRVKRKS